MLNGGALHGVVECCILDQLANDGERAAVRVLVSSFLHVRVRMAGFVQVLGPGLVRERGDGWRPLMLEAACSFGQHVPFEDMNLGRGDAAAVDLLDFERCAEIQGARGLLQDGEGYTGIHQGAEKHVAGDAGKAIQISNPHQ